MPDILSDHEIAAIAAFKGDRDWDDVVRHIPYGHTVANADFRWVPGKGPDANGTIEGGKHWKSQRDGFMKRRVRDMKFQALKRREDAGVEPAQTIRDAQHAAIAKRRAEVRKLTHEGLNHPEIAFRMGVSESTIGADVAAMRKEGGFPSAQECRAIRRRRGWS